MTDILKRLKAGEFDARATDWGRAYELHASPRKKREWRTVTDEQGTYDKPVEVGKPIKTTGRARGDREREIKALGLALDQVRRAIHGLHHDSRERLEEEFGEAIRELISLSCFVMKPILPQNVADFDAGGSRKRQSRKAMSRKVFVRRCAAFYQEQTGGEDPTVSGSSLTEFQRFVEGMAERGGVPVQGLRGVIEEVLRDLRELLSKPRSV